MAIADIAIKIVTKGAELAKRQLGGLGKGADKTKGSLLNLSSAMKTGLAVSAVALAKGVQASVKEFTEFEEKLNQSLAIMKTTEAQQEAMVRATQKVAMETRIGTKESAEAYFFLASAGLDAEQSISALPQVAKFAQAGMFDMATATDLATDAQSALGLTVDDAQANLSNLTRVTDVLVKANTLANASVQQFSEALTNKAGAALKVVNKDVEEGVAVLAVFADRGVKGAEAGEKLNQVLRDIPRATAKNKSEFEKLGLELFTSEGKMKNVADVVEELDRVLGPMSDELKASTLDQLGLNRGVADAVKILSGAGDEIRKYEDALRDAGGTTDDIANNQMKSIQAELDTLHNKWEILLQDIGKDFEGVTRGTIGFFDRLITKIIELRQKADEGTLTPYVGVLREVDVEIAGQIVTVTRLVQVTRDLTNTHDAERDAVEAYNASLEDLRPTKEEVAKATEEEIEAEQKLAKERSDKALGALNKVLKAYKKYQNIFQEQQDLIDEAKEAEKKLSDQKAEEKIANDNVNSSLDELNRQKELSKLVTLEEELAIIRANQALSKAQEELDGTREKQLEYELAKKRLTEVTEASTSATNDEINAQREYESALKDLERAEERTRKAQLEYQEAQRLSAEATANSTENILEQAIAKKELDDALADATALGALEEGVRQMVESVGGDLDKLTEHFNKLFSLQGKQFTPDTNTSGEIFDTMGNVNTSGGTSPVDKFAFTPGQSGGVTTINHIKVSVEGALQDGQSIQDAVAVALLQAQKRGTKVVL